MFKRFFASRWRTVAVLIFLVVVGIQFVPVQRDNPPVVMDFQGPENVKTIFKNSCYDCHSNETKWPWYSYVAPASWLVAYDVNHGKEYLNFSDWERYATEDMKEEILEEISKHKMPLPIYLFLHPEAAISEDQLLAIKQWRESNEPASR